MRSAQWRLSEQLNRYMTADVLAAMLCISGHNACKLNTA